MGAAARLARWRRGAGAEQGVGQRRQLRRRRRLRDPQRQRRLCRARRRRRAHRLRARRQRLQSQLRGFGDRQRRQRALLRAGADAQLDRRPDGGGRLLGAAAAMSEALALPAMRSPLRAAITAAYRRPEPEAVPPLVAAARLPAPAAAAAQALARRLAQTLRERKSAAGREGLVQGLLQEYSLSSQEGVALMCLAEALLRIPDPATRDALIRDKISTGQWHEHLGRSPSLFVNAATWALLLTGKLVSTHSESSLSSALARLVGKGGEPLIRKSVDRAMRLMGEQFVTGETIASALARSRALEAQGFRYSYDMLGEAALTAEDAARYRRAYE